MRIESDQAAEEQAIHVPVGRIVQIKHGIQASKRTNQGLGINTSADRFGQDWVDRRLLGEQEHRHHNQRQGNNQELPAQFFHGHKLKKGRFRAYQQTGAGLS